MMPAATRYSIFAISGVAAIAVAAATDSTQYSLIHAVFLNLGLVALAVVLIDALWRVAGGNPVEGHIASLNREIGRLARTVDVIQNTQAVGLECVFDCTGNYGSQADWLALIQSAENRVDLMGRALEGWVRPNEMVALLEEKILNGNVEFRWLVMSEDNQYLHLLEEQGTLLTERVSHKLPSVYDRLREVRARLPGDKKSRLKVRVFANEPLYCSVVRVDDHFLLTPYLASVGSRDCPLICFRGADSPWARSIGTEFEHIWNGGVDLFERDGPNDGPHC